ncbi:hypothetical protein [Paracoccus sulfuroxidans]|uniref:Uncharacterized protein n=1 Tax=Paracoccus sulfuroxidans TaxID=384678 RepID=A0A562NH14_9RHOB|nr:hypothetical protein [Paracoccus sulfuroxidans]TWI31201.1 hypothetical protein IQ24_03059 [Paracoccus sulfuroxidans]
MSPFVRASLTAVVALSIANAARADWKSTRWGMTPEELGANAALSVQLTPEEDQQDDPVMGKVMATAPHELPDHPGYEGLVELIFEDGLLTAVLDTFPDYDPDKTLKNLAAAYGEPVAALDGVGRRDRCWIDKNNSDNVWYTVFQGPSLAYETVFYTSASNPAGCKLPLND